MSQTTRVKTALSFGICAACCLWFLSARAHAELWISHDELMDLPTAGPAWEALARVAAREDISQPLLSDQDDHTDSHTLAKALVGVRTGNQEYIDQVRETVMQAIGTEEGGRTLALGRNLVSYVVSADLVGLSEDDDTVFRSWLHDVLSENLDGRTLRSTHEDRPNNWGTHAGAARAAVVAYLGDQGELQRAAAVFKGFLGDRDAWDGFDFGGPSGEEDHSWEHDPLAPVGINPIDAILDGMPVGGALPDDMRRGGPLAWPPGETEYPFEALQGALVQAEILFRQGFDTWEWEDHALLRAFEFLEGIDWHPEGDDAWMTALLNARCNTDFPENPWAQHGKNVGWTAWTHGRPFAAAVPEPGTLLLLAIGGGVLFVMRRRRK